MALCDGCLRRARETRLRKKIGGNPPSQERTRARENKQKCCFECKQTRELATDLKVMPERLTAREWFASAGRVHAEAKTDRNFNQIKLLLIIETNQSG